MKKLVSLILVSVLASLSFAQPCSDLYFSEYIEGSLSNKALEIYNPTSSNVDLSTYKVKRYNNGTVIQSDSLVLFGTLAPGAVFIIGNAGADTAIINISDTLSSMTWFNGNDAIALFHGSLMIDVIGEIGIDPGFGWPVGIGATNNYTLVRKDSTLQGTNDWAINSTSWDVYPIDNFSHIGGHTQISCSTILAPDIAINPVAITVQEGGLVNISLVITNSNSNATMVDLSVDSSSTATFGTDYFLTIGSYTFPPNSSSAISIFLTVNDDALPEGDETIILNLSNATNNATISVGQAIYTIERNDHPTPVYSIGDVKTFNPLDCTHDSVGVTCILKGVVHGSNFRPGGYQFYIHDGTGGMNVFSFTQGAIVYSVTEGDSIWVEGTLTEFNGLLEIAPANITLISQNNTLQNPTPVTFLNESLESDYVVFENAWLVDPLQWISIGSGFNCDVTNGSDTIQIRIDFDSPFFSQAAPVGIFDIIGVASQFDNSYPFCDGYQVYAMIFDTVTCAAPDGLFSDRETPSSVRLHWNIFPDANGYEIRGRNVNGATWTNLIVPSGATFHYDAQGLPNGITFVWQIRSLCDGGTVVSVWSALDSFTTGCYPTDSIWTIPVVSNGARLNWTMRPGALGYEIRGQRVGAAGWTNIVVGPTNPFKDVFGLLPATTYTWTVRTLCNSTGTLASPYVPLIQFTTTTAGKMGGGAFTFEGSRTEVFPNPVSSSFNLKLGEEFVGGSATLFDVNGSLIRIIDLTDIDMNVNRDGLPVGIYFIRLNATNGSSEMLKVVLEQGRL